MKTKSSYKQSASTLAVVIATLAILMVIVGVAIDYTTHVNRNVQRTTTLQTALAVGDSAIEVLFNNWRATCRNPSNVTQPLPTNSFTAIPTPSPFPNLPTTNFVKRGIGLDPAIDSDYDPAYTISNYKVIAVSAEYTAVPNPASPSASATPEPQLGQVGPNVAPTPGVNCSATYSYIASADVTLNASFGSATQRNVVAKVRRIFQKQELWPWNWAIFYVDPLEIHPGPLFTVTGWVHTNSDLYTAHNTLTFADKVTYAGDWFINFMPGDGTHGETPQSPNYPNGLPPARDQAMQPFGLDSTSIFNTSDPNPNNDSYAELIQPPASGFTDPFAGQRYWDQAAIIIDVSDNNSASTKGGIVGPGNVGTGANGADFIKLYTVNSSTGATTQITSGELYNLFAAAGAITTNQTMQDNREGASLRIATLDVSKIVSSPSSGNPTYLHSGSDFGTANGNPPIIYMYDSSSTSTNRRGIRVKGGSKIPTAGFTLASNNPVYIQGDFNTGATGSSVPSNNPSNLKSDGTYINPANPPSPVYNPYDPYTNPTGYHQAPTSVLADAVNILSANWNDANSNASLGSRPATATTVNAAIVSGIVTTNVYNDGGYSGGAENFPRFLEDWTNKPLTYYGSMVELFKSQQSIGEWHYDAPFYKAPAREWFFDNNFKMNPPPGSLMVYSYIKGRWFVL